ncbi:DnaJ protein -like protein 2 [Capsicum annuum]|nr:DnaJ protein -like protein 2 [Capsicum annuum]
MGGGGGGHDQFDIFQSFFGDDGSPFGSGGSSRGRRQRRGEDVIHPLKHPCNECKGTGETISDKDRCPQCKGEKVMQEKKVLEVHVEKGMQNGQKFVLTHLDNRPLLIKSQPGKVVKPDQFKAINDEGMLLYQRPFMRGKLYVHFTVDFPDSLTPEQCKNL